MKMCDNWTMQAYHQLDLYDLPLIHPLIITPKRTVFGVIFCAFIKPWIKEKTNIMKLKGINVEKYVSPLIRTVVLRSNCVLCLSLHGNTGTESLIGGKDGKEEIIISGGDTGWTF